MISLQAYRAAIGAFYCTNRKSSSTGGDNFCHDPHRGSYEMFFVLRLFGFAILTLVMACNVNLAYLRILELLRSGDVETNPGPSTYTSLKVVKASYHQGHCKYGNSAGMQCMCNCLFAICFNAVKRVALWATVDLDFIFDKGDEMYKNINASGPLSIQELPLRIPSGCGVH